MQKKLSKNWIIGIICAAVVVATIVCLIVFVGFRTDRYTKGLVIEREGNSYVVSSLGSATDTDIIVPKYYKGKKVTTIAEGAFANSNITRIKLPNSLKVVESQAFANCDKLTTITFDGEQKQIIFNGGFLCNGVEFGQDVFVGTNFMSLDIADSNDGDSVTYATLNQIPQDITKIKITAALFDSTDIEFESVIELSGEDSKQAEVDFGTYGYFTDIEVEVYQDQTLIYKDSGEGVTITSPHYNIAYLNATYPVLVYSLKLHEIAAEYPTFTFLERAKAYDWSKLPYNAQCLPFVTFEQATTEFNFHAYREAMASYINQLYTLDNTSTFTFYCVDNYAELILQYFIGNGIPTENWNAIMIGDGAGPAVYLSEAFAVQNPQAKYNSMKQNWQEIKEYTRQNGYNIKNIYKMVDEKWDDSVGKYSVLIYYTYIIAKEEANIDWWVNRLRTGENLSAITAYDAEFSQDIVDSAISYYTNNLLAALDEQQKQTFKELYHFNDEMFDTARESGKKIMIIIGSDGATESDDVYNYIRLTMDLYGDDYIYYYKGHPGFPTSLNKLRQQHFAQLKQDGYELLELDNSIAAEVIMYFNPDVYLSGWKSSTYESAAEESMVCSIFSCSMEEKTIHTYGSIVDVFMTVLQDPTFNGITFNNSHKYYLLEYNNTAEYDSQVANYNKHEIAIYDSTTKTLTFYKLNQTSGVYEVVSQ